jgi:hypothetical protein
MRQPGLKNNLYQNGAAQRMRCSDNLKETL